MPEGGPHQSREEGPSAQSLLAHTLLCAAVGLAVGAVGGTFRLALDFVTSLRSRSMGLLDQGAWPLPPTLFAAAVGVFLIGWGIGAAVRRISPQAAGSGIQDVEAVMHRVAPIRWARLAIVKFIGGAAGIGAGLSLGREGPTVQLGAAAARGVGSMLGLRPQEASRLLAVGAGAGLAAAFSAPLAGSVFMFEELRRSLSMRNLVGALVACACATLVVQTLCGGGTLIPTTQVRPMGWSELPAVILLGLAAGAFGALLNAAFVATVKLAASVPPRLRETLPGAALVGMLLLALAMPQAAGDGLSVIQQLLGPRDADPGPANPPSPAGAGWLAALLLLKFVATVACFGSGAPGGIFSPMMLMGTLLGLLLCRGAEALMPGLAGQEGTFALLAMAAVFSGSVRAPLTGIVLVIELTGQTAPMIGLIVASAAAFVAARTLRSPPIYESLLALEVAALEVSRSSRGASRG